MRKVGINQTASDKRQEDAQECRAVLEMFGGELEQATDLEMMLMREILKAAAAEYIRKMKEAR
jgi:hypothetical protein